jgi:hypothetical protein
VFFMDFRDELVYAGQFNTDLGYPVLGNAAQSVHQGVELEGETWLGAAPSSSAGGANPAVRLRGNAVFGDHYFVEYREQYGPTPADEVIYDGNAIGFFPATLANATADLNWRGLSVGAGARYVGRIYLDNTETKSVSIEPHTIMDASAGFTRAVGAQGTRVGLNVRVFNVLDEKYETGGYLDFDASGALVPVFIPAATRNVLAELRINW